MKKEPWPEDGSDSDPRWEGPEGAAVLEQMVGRPTPRRPVKVIPFTKPATGPETFEIADEVIVSSFDSPFYTWRGKVSAVLVSNDEQKYQVRFLVANNSILLPALLFKFGELEKVK